MGTRNYGPSVSGYLDPTGRAWEDVVFEAGKPVLDKELNLTQSIAELRPTASGWISPDFLATSAGNISAIFTGGSAGNVITLPGMLASVNGWQIPVANISTGVPNSGFAASITTYVDGIATITGLTNMTPESVGEYIVIGVPYAVSTIISDGGLIEIHTSTANPLVTGNTVQIAGVVGTVEANGTWVVTVIDSSHFTLNGSAFVNAYISGGIVTVGAATANNNGSFQITAYISPSSVSYANPFGVAPDANNGYIAWVSNTAASIADANSLTLPSAPVGTSPSTLQRTDLIFLEVWRLLLSPAPSTVGKSMSGLIWWNGNVQVSAADDPTINFPDDILDATLGAESTKRVQIQYRLRVIPGVDLFGHPYGMDDPTVFANTVPASATLPNGTVTTYTYVNQSPNGDGGLWVAGDGNPANTLGTVDGYMYAIPLMAVFRRNATLFSPTNQNGNSTASPGPSDRPDNLFNDVVVSDDIADLRSASGAWDYQEVLDKNVTYLLDNALRSEWTTTANGGGVTGHSVLYANSLGYNTPGVADPMGLSPQYAQFDATRRAFSDLPVTETVIVSIPAPGGGWVTGSTFTIDPTSLTIPPYGVFNWASFNNALVQWSDITNAQWVGSTGGKKTANATPYLAVVSGLGTLPVTPVSVTIGNVTSLGLTNETLYIELVVSYPPGQGLTRTPVETYGTSSFMVNNPSTLPDTTPIWFDQTQLVLNATSGITYLNNPTDPAPSYNLSGFDPTHRGIWLTYATTPGSGTGTYVSQAADTSGVVGANVSIPLPERALSVTSAGCFVKRNGVAVSHGTPALTSDGRTVVVNSGDASSPGDVWEVSYVAVRPLPQNGEQVTTFFEARAAQSARLTYGGSPITSLTVVPRCIPKQLYAITIGPSSPGEGYPFPQAYVQTGGVYPSTSATFTGENELRGDSEVSTATFNATTGLLALSTFVNYTPDPDGVTFLRAPTDFDAEGRTFFKSVPSGYIPNAYAQSLSDQQMHKNVLPFLAELTSDSQLGVAGQLVLVLLIRWAPSDEVNGVFFDTNLAVSTTSASVFRLRNNLLNKGGF